METVISADGTRIAVERSGSGLPLVMVHGTARDRSCWDRVAEELRDRAEVVVFDRRGRPDSHDGQAYSLAREADDILAVVDSIQEPVVLFGHSFGGIVALEAALRSRSLRGLILYEPPLPTGVSTVPGDLGDRLQTILETGDRDAVVVTFLQEGPRYPPEEIAKRRASPDWQVRLAMAHTLPRETLAVNQYSFDAGRAANLDVPTLLLLGSQSPPLFQDAIALLHGAIANSEVVVLEGQHHNAMDTAPALLADAVSGFLQRLAVA